MCRRTCVHTYADTAAFAQTCRFCDHRSEPAEDCRQPLSAGQCNSLREIAISRCYACHRHEPSYCVRGLCIRCHCRSGYCSCPGHTVIILFASRETTNVLDSQSLASCSDITLPSHPLTSSTARCRAAAVTPSGGNGSSSSSRSTGSSRA